MQGKCWLPHSHRRSIDDLSNEPDNYSAIQTVVLGTKWKNDVTKICTCKWKHQQQATETTEAGGVSSRLWRDLDYPPVENFSELLSSYVGQSQGEEDQFICEPPPMFVQHETSNLKAKLKQTWLLLCHSNKWWAHGEFKRCSGKEVFEMQPQRHQFSNWCEAFDTAASQLDWWAGWWPIVTALGTLAGRWS